MSIALVVRDIVNASSLCVKRYPSAGLSRAEWIAGGIKRSAQHGSRPSKISEYVNALIEIGEHEAAEIAASQAAEERKS